MPPTNLGRGDPSLVLIDHAKRIERLERRPKTGTTSGVAGSVKTGSFIELSSQTLNTPVSTSAAPPFSSTLKSWTTGAGALGVDISGADGKVVLTTPGLYAVYGTVTLAGVDSSGAGTSVEIFPGAGVSPSTGINTMVFDPDAGLPGGDLIISGPVAYTGMLTAFYVIGFFDTTPAGTGGIDGKPAGSCHLLITALTSA